MRLFKFILPLLIFWSNYSFSQQINFTEIPQNLHFYARDDNNKANISLSGNVIQAGFDSIKVSLLRNNILQNKYSLKLNYINGKASFSFQIPIISEFAEYSISIYLDNTFIIKRDSIVCGDVFIINGQSNSHPYGNLAYKNEYWRSFGQHTNYDNYNAADTAFGLATGWGWYNMPFAVGAWGIEIQRLITSSYNVPVLILNGGSGGSSIEYNLRDDNNRQNLTTTYGRLLYRATKAGLANKVKAIMWHQGESNSYSSIYLNYSTYFDKLYKAWKEDYAGIKKIYVFQIHQGCGGDAQTEIREIQRNFEKKYSDVNVMSTVGLSGHDGCHYTNIGYNQMASWIYPLIARDFYNSNDTNDILPPNVSRIYYLDKYQTKIGIDFSQKINYPADLNGQSLKNYIYFDTTTYGCVKDAYKSGDKSVLLELNSSSGFKKLTYLPNLYYNNTTTIYEGPWITGLRGVGALSFHLQDISESLQLTEQPLPQVVCSDNTDINLKILAKGLIENYTWQKSLDNGISWNNIPNTNSNSIIFRINQTNYGEGLYRCVVKGEQLIQPDTVMSAPVEVKMMKKVTSINLTEFEQKPEYLICDTLSLSVKTDGNPEFYIIQIENQGKYKTVAYGKCNFEKEFQIRKPIKCKESGNYRIGLFSSFCSLKDTLYSNSIAVKMATPIKLAYEGTNIFACNNEDLRIETISNYSIRKYKWLKNGEPIGSKDNPNYNQSFLNLPKVSSYDEGEYTCKVIASVCDSVYEFTTNSFNLKVNSDYVIKEVINNGQYFVKDTAELQVNTNNNLNTQFQWLKNGEIIKDGAKYLGTNTNQLKIYDLTLSDILSSKYSCITNSGNCSDTSDYIYLKIKDYSITIDSQPDKISGCEGDSATIKVISYSNCKEVKFEWFKNGLPINDPDFHQFLSFLTIVNLDKESEGNYQLKITGEPGPVEKWSKIIPVKVYFKPEIINHSDSLVKIKEGESTVLFVKSNETNFEYQWFKDNQPIENANKDTLYLNNCLSKDGGAYYCEVKNICGMKKSTNFFIDVLKGSSASDITQTYLIHPNPASEYINIDLSFLRMQETEIQIFNVFGECVLTVEAQNFESLQRIYVSHLPAGMYFVRIGDERPLKFVKM